MAMQALGHEALHASAMRAARGVVLFAAQSRTGKSTVAFGLSCRGYEQWSDDGVVFSVAEEGATAVPLPFDVRLRPQSADILGSAARPAVRCDGGVFQREPEPYRRHLPLEPHR